MHATVRFSFMSALAVLALLAIPHESMAAQISVGMGPDYFTPPNSVVYAGDNVVWTNTSTMAHTVTADDGAFGSGTMQPGAVFSHAFSAPGTYFYHCSFHQGMVGSITVLAGTNPNTVPSAAGAFPPNVSQFTRLVGENHVPIDQYTYLVPPEDANTWTKLISIIRYPESQGATVQKMQEYADAAMALSRSVNGDITSIKDYAANISLPVTRAFITTVQSGNATTGKWNVEMNMHKFILKNGYIYANVYSERYQFDSANASTGKVNERRPQLAAAMDAFVATVFPDPMLGGSPIQNSTYAPSPTYTTQSNIPASSSDALRAQAEALLVKLQQLKQQLAASQTNVTNTNVSGNSGGTIDSSACPLIGRALKRGSTGDDVTRLQRFLARDTSIYPEGQVTGFYGALTEAAVKRWQVKYNIVSSGTPATTGYGVVGPRTAAAIALVCSTMTSGGNTTPPSEPIVGGYIHVTPISGNAPLSVAVQATINTVNSCNGANYILDWGDNTQPQQLVQPAGNCVQQTQTLGHTYRSDGSYQITLIAGSHRTYATVQVFGTPLTPAPPPTPTPVPPPAPAPAPTPSPSPTTQEPFVVTPGIADNPLAVQTDFNIASPCSAFDLDWGDGGTHVTQAESTCTPVVTAKTYQHTFAASGTYTITLVRDAQTDTASVNISAY